MKIRTSSHRTPGAARGAKKLILATLVSLALLIFLCGQFYKAIQSEAWKEEEAAIQIAFENTEMVHVSRVEPFVGEQPYMIVHGENSAGESLISWISDSEIHSEYVDDGISLHDVGSYVMAKAPDAQIIRIVPGKFNGVFVWEVFFKQQDRYYYHYYRFSNGEHLETYNLSLQSY